MLVKLIVNTEYKLLFCEAAVMCLIYGTVWTDKVHNTIVCIVVIHWILKVMRMKYIVQWFLELLNLTIPQLFKEIKVRSTVPNCTFFAIFFPVKK